MLTYEFSKLDLIKEKKDALDRLSDELKKYKSGNETVYQFNYNVLNLSLIHISEPTRPY